MDVPHTNLLARRWRQRVAVRARPGSLAHLVAVTVAGAIAIGPGVVFPAQRVAAASGNLVMITGDGAFDGGSDSHKRAVLEGLGWAVDAVDDDTSVAGFAAATTSDTADVVFVSDTARADVADDLRDLTIGIVNENAGGWSGLLYSPVSGEEAVGAATIDIIDDSHAITSSFEIGTHTVHTEAADITFWNTDTAALPSGVTTLARGPGGDGHALIVADIGASLSSGNTASNRRVWFPSAGTDPAAWSAGLHTLLERSLDWAGERPDGPCGADADGDGICDDHEDADLDGDGDPATLPGPDTDGDTTPDYLDPDDDGDGTPTASERPDPNRDGHPRDARDSDRDGQPDYLDGPTGASTGRVVAHRVISPAGGGLTDPLDDLDRFGRSVAAIGDLDADGIPELVVGAPGDDDHETDSGAVYVLFLDRDGTVRAEQKLSNAAGGVGDGRRAFDGFGERVAGIGDVDGDGVPDLAIGAFGADDGGAGRGAVEVVFMNADGTARAVRRISDTAGGLGAALDDLDGFGAVTGIGDLDGDGVPDLAVGSPRDGDGGVSRGAVHVLFLTADGAVRAEQKISSTTGWPGAELADDDRFGIDVAALGDVDGDGTVDLAVGSEGADEGGADRGRVDVLFLNPDGTVRRHHRVDDVAGGLARPLTDGDRFGASVAALGDVDGDGTPDIAVGAPRDDGSGAGSDRGAVHLLFLAPDGSVVRERTIGDVYGELGAVLADGDRFGVSVAGLGDLDGDGAIDLAVGAGDAGGGGTGRGAVHIVFTERDLPGEPAIVNSSGDAADAAPGDGVCETATAGECTLRAAIGEANASSAVDAVVFAIPQSDPGYDGGTGTFTITPGSTYPTMVRRVAIDGSTQAETGALPAIVIDGSSTGAAITDHAFLLGPGSGGSTLHRLSVHSFPGIAVGAADSGHHLLTGLVLGLGPDGTAPMGNRYGVYTERAGYLTIGGTTATTRNVVSANEWGIALYDDSSRTRIVGNRIGTDHTGLQARGNDRVGIFVVNSSSYVSIGGPAAGEGNVVSANGEDGIYVGSGAMIGPVVEGNLVGLGADGRQPLPNGHDGIELAWGDGGTATGNTVGPQGRSGIRLTAHDGAVIHGNTVGIDSAGAAAWTIGEAGVMVGASVDGARIGGLGAGEANVIANGASGGVVVSADAGSRNAILSNTILSGPRRPGALPRGAAIDLGADGVTRNDAGDGDAGPNDLLNRPVLAGATGVAGTVEVEVLADLPAGDYRVEIFDAAGEAPFGGGGGRGPVHAVDIGHTGGGMESFPTSFSGVVGDVLTATVTADEGAGVFGSTSEFSYATTVVGPSTLVVNSTGDGDDETPGDSTCDTGETTALGVAECTLRAAITESAAHAETTALAFEISDLDAGYDAAGGYWTITPQRLALPRVATALTIDATTQPTYTDRPVIDLDGSGPSLGAVVAGLRITGAGTEVRGLSFTNWPDDGARAAADGIVFTRNRFGIDPVGTVGPNGGADLAIEGSAGGVRVGGAAATDANVFAASGPAISILDAADATVVRSNTFGLSPDGISPTGAAGDAIVIGADATGTIVDANTFAHLGGSAIAATGAATGTVVTGNTIGLDTAGGAAPVSRAVRSDAAGTLRFGGTLAGEGNTVAGTTTAAAVVVDADDATVTVLGNSFVDVAGIAIDLGDDGVTANDPGDGDAGPNRLLNRPVITSVAGAGATVTVDLELDVPAGEYRVEVFANPTATDPAGEGEVLIHAETVTHTGTGVEPFTLSAPGSIDDRLTATVTERSAGPSYGATSEFSMPLAVVPVATGSATVVVNSTGDAADASPGDGVCETGGTIAGGHPECTLRAAIAEANASGRIDAIDFDVPGVDPGHGDGVWTISPASALPGITGAVFLDARTQPAWAGEPVVELDGSVAGSDIGIRVQHGAGTFVGGLAIGGYRRPIVLEAASTTVSNTWVGVRADGTTLWPGTLDGISVASGADGAVIGGPGQFDGNVVAGSSGSGIAVWAAADTVVEGNLIGVLPDGATAAPNAGGIAIGGASLRARVGGTVAGQANLVAHNTGTGVEVASGSDHSVIGNSIHSNGGLGIDLGPAGPAANDPGDGDAGANDMLNSPIIAAATVRGRAGRGEVAVDVALDVPAGVYRVELFANPSGADPSGHGEGEIFLGAVTRTHAGSGVETFSAGVSGSAGDVLSATVTEVLGAGAYGSTSELAAVRTVIPSGGTVLDHSGRRSDLVAVGGLELAASAGVVAGGIELAGGTGRLVGPPTEIGSGALTLSGWVNASELSADVHLISKAPTGDGAIYELAIDGATGEAVARLGAGDTTVEARGGAVAVGDWHQIAATWDGAALTLYVDGAAVDTAAAPGPLAGDVAAPLVVGNSEASTGGLAGLIDQVRIDHTARSAGWIETEFNNLTDPAAMVTIGAVQTAPPGSWTATPTVSRRGSHSLAAPAVIGLVDAWAVATDIDEAGTAFESWWYLTDPATTVAAAGTGTGRVATDQIEASSAAAGFDLGVVAGATRTVAGASSSSIAPGVWTRVEIRTDETGASSVWLNGVPIIARTPLGGRSPSGSVGLRAGELPVGESWYVDDVRIRRYVSDEPTTTLAALDRY